MSGVDLLLPAVGGLAGGLVAFAGIVAFERLSAWRRNRKASR